MKRKLKVTNECSRLIQYLKLTCQRAIFIHVENRSASFGSRLSGAVGSRLTGAGWGGCAVSMVPSEKVESFLQKVREQYYMPDSRRAALEKQSLFVSKPGGGAAIFLEE